MSNNRHLGETLDEFLAGLGILDECEDTAIEQMITETKKSPLNVDGDKLC